MREKQTGWRSRVDLNFRDLGRAGNRLDVRQFESALVAPIDELFYRAARMPSGYCGCGWGR
jgi:hypothetical protein